MNKIKSKGQAQEDRIWIINQWFKRHFIKGWSNQDKKTHRRWLSELKKQLKEGGG